MNSFIGVKGMNNYMKKGASNKITNLSFILTLLIVLLHADWMFMSDHMNRFYTLSKSINNVINLIGHISVPTFFSISTFLFFRNFKISGYKKKMKSRMKTLAIPYIFFSTVFFIYAVVGSKIVLKLNLDIEVLHIQYNFISFIKIIFISSIDGPLWYIRNLLIYFLFSPVIYYFVTRLKKKNVLIISTFILINLFVVPEYSSLLYWLPLFYTTAYLTLYYSKKIENENLQFGNWQYLFYVAFGILFILLVFYSDNDMLLYIYRMIVPFIIWLIAKKNKFLSRVPKNITKYSFIIYCIHFPKYFSFMAIIQQLFLKIFGNNPIYLLLLRFVVWILVVLFAISFAKIINKLFPKFTKNILGGRI